MRTKPAAILVGLVALGCATGPPPAPLCSGESERPRLSAECRADPETVRLLGELRELLQSAAGDQLVRVAFDATGAVDGVCLEPGLHDEWSSRWRVGRRLPEVHVLAPGPGCLAGAHLEMNRLPAKVAEIEEVARLCTRTRALTADRCMEREQVYRGEIWLRRGTLPFIYLRREDGSDRRSAILACLRNRTPLTRAPNDAEMQVLLAVDAAEVDSCMSQQGWERLTND